MQDEGVQESNGSIHVVLRQMVERRDPHALARIFQVVRESVAARIYLRRCTSIGPRARIVGRPRIDNKGQIVIGERVRIHSHIVPVELAAMRGGRIEIGERTFINYGVSISSFQFVHIGCRCLIGTYVNILDNNWHDILDRTRVPPSKPVIIEDNVWLGNRVIVLPGVTIGHDAVIGAGAVVTKDIPPRSIAVGNPARVVKAF